ncbi:MAG: aspartate aminotransferase family protein [Acidobacteriota bacterium]
MIDSGTVSSSIFHASEHEARLRNKAAGSIARGERARRALAGGVSSGLRRSARPFPLYFERGQGSRLWDVDGNEYLDYMLGWGPLILGHAPEAVNRAVAEHLRSGHTFGAQHDLEFEVAELLTQIIPCADAVAFANSGTEIVQVALRLARAFTGRSRFLKFEGHYHGWDDSVLVSYHPSEQEISRFGDEPVPTGAGQRGDAGPVVAQWNDRDSVERAFDRHGDEIAAVICEPLLCNSGCIAPEPGFLEFLREITRRKGALLIFDEVITGFRLALGGAQQYYGVTPDLATYAKAVGAGLPLSVLAGKAEVMELIASGKVVHAGTLNGNPLVLAAARAALEALAAGNGAVYQKMWRLGNRLRDGVVSRLQATQLPVVATGGGPVFQLLFQTSTPRNYRETLAANRVLYGDLAVALLDEGVTVLQAGRWYLSTAHDEHDIDDTLGALDRVLG